MAAKSEPLSWEVLDYWKASGLPFCASIPSSTIVYRGSKGEVKGFCALSNRQDTAMRLVIEPLIADSGPIAIKVIDCLEQWMIANRLPGYVFYIEEDNERYHGVIKKLVADGLFTSLGPTKRGNGKVFWYGRKF